MEIPEKIYIQPNAHDRWFEGNKPNDNFIEYVRKDALIKKACDFIRINAEKHIYFDEGNSEWYDSEEFIADFRNYMKGE